MESKIIIEDLEKMIMEEEEKIKKCKSNIEALSQAIRWI